MISRSIAFILLIWMLGFAWFALLLPQPAPIAQTGAVVWQTRVIDYLTQLGVNVTEGLGAGSQPEVGRAAAEAAQMKAA